MKLKVGGLNSIKMKFKGPISKNCKVQGPNYESFLLLLYINISIYGLWWHFEFYMDYVGLIIVCRANICLLVL